MNLHSSNKTQLDLMRKACLLCDNSTLDVKTGCLAILDGNVIATGWNHDAIDVVIHAEMALLDDATRNKVSLNGSEIYTTRFPCPECAKMLFDQHITRVFYMSDHFTSNNLASKFLQENGIDLIKLEEHLVWSK